ncbi:Uncharacterised protein [Klebsiella variicola]|nr:Uncharacterised protein [Klebsiella variicola]
MCAMDRSSDDSLSQSVNVNKALNILGLFSPFISCVFLCNDLSIRSRIGEVVCQSVIPTLEISILFPFTLMTTLMHF